MADTRTLAERFQVRLEAELAAIEQVLGDPSAPLALVRFVGEDEDSREALERDARRLEPLLDTAKDLPFIVHVERGSFPGVFTIPKDGEPPRHDDGLTREASCKFFVYPVAVALALGVEGEFPDLRGPLEHLPVPLQGAARLLVRVDQARALERKGAVTRAGECAERWPPELEGVVTVGQALDLAKQSVAGLAAAAAEEAEAIVRILAPDEVRAAILGRSTLVERWFALPSRPYLAAHICWDMLLDGAALAEGRRLEPRPPPGMPPEVAPLDAFNWARDALARATDPKWLAVVERMDTAVKNAPWPNEVRTHLEHRSGVPEEFQVVDAEARRTRTVTQHALGVVYLTWTEVEDGRKRRGFAVDAGMVHHNLLGNWIAMPKDPRRKGRQARVRQEPDGWVEIIPPAGHGQPVSLGLPGLFMEQFVRALREWRSFRGLRHWAAFQQLLSENHREGWFDWYLEKHLEAMRIPRSEWRDDLLKNVAQDVELFLELEIAVRESQYGRVRYRAKVFEVVKRDVLERGRWRLDGARLRIQPLLYNGVRKESGELGTNFGWAPAELAGLRDARFGPAIALGLILPIRWRLAVNERRRDVALAGGSILQLAGIQYHKHKPAEAWTRLERNLRELQHVHGLDSWRWEEWGERRERRPDLRNVVRLSPPAWVQDRMFHGVRPLELGPRPLTGTELRTWRESRGLTQSDAAQALGVSERTLRGAESAAAKALGPALRDALRAAMPAPPNGP